MIKKELFKSNLLFSLTKHALLLLPHIARFTDLDGVVHTSKIRKEVIMLPDTYDRAMACLIERGVLQQDGSVLRFPYFYPYDENDKGYRYIGTFAFMKQSAFYRLSKRSLILLYRILAHRLPGMPLKTTYENWYETMFNTRGESLFENHKETFKVFHALLEADYIEVSTNKPLHGTVEERLSQLKAYLGYDLVTDKKKRVSEKTKHTLSIRINPTLIGKGQVLFNASSLVEMEEVCFEYGIDFDYLLTHEKQEEARQKKENLSDKECKFQLRYFIGLKNELFEKFGSIGVSLYRDAFSEYLHDNHETMQYHVTTGHAVDYFKSIYVLPKMITVLTPALDSFFAESVVDVANNLFAKRYTHTIDFILKHGDYSHFVMTDDVIQHHREHSEILSDASVPKGTELYEIIGKRHAAWLHLLEKIKESYRYYMLEFLKHEHIQANMSLRELEQVIRDWVNKEREGEKEKLAAAIHHISLKVCPIRKVPKVVAPEKATNLFPTNYNWLTAEKTN